MKPGYGRLLHAQVKVYKPILEAVLATVALTVISTVSTYASSTTYPL
jgi:hypothetical protein